MEIIGVDIDAINITEDRQQFKELMQKLEIPVAPQKQLLLFKGERNCTKIWFSLSDSPSFTLGGTGASFVHKARILINC